MLNKNLHFIHKFDEKMHYSIYHSLLNHKDKDGIDINDSVQSKKCDRFGRWNFIVDNEDYSCGIYHALEVVRQGIFSAMENNKNSVDIALVSSKNNSDACYVFNYEEFEDHIDIEQLKKAKAFDKKCECDIKSSKRIFFKIIKPVLKEVFKKTDYLITTKVFKKKTVSECVGQTLINFKKDLSIMHIEWNVDNFFNDLIMDQKIAKMELQLTA